MSGIYGEILQFPQGDDKTIRLKVFGTEHYSRFENLDGFTVMFNEDTGLYCYALRDGNYLKPSTVPAEDPAPEGLKRHLQETPKAINAKLEHHAAHKSSRDHSHTHFSLGANKALLPGRVLSKGDILGLTIIVEFADVSTTVTQQEVDDMLNMQGYTDHGNACSVNEYFKTMSSGKLNYTNVVVGPIRLQHNRRHYVHNLMVKEVMDEVVARGVNLHQFDSRGDRIIDAVNILYAGRSLYDGNLWPHNSTSVNTYEIDGMEISTELYLLTGLGRTPSIGTFCHENGHLLCRFPDMYDYGQRDGDQALSSGIGRYCLMGSGNHLGNGRRPAPISVYLRHLAGWCDNFIRLNTPGHYTAVHGDYSTAMVYHTSKENEYFMVENRTAQGFDVSLPSSGLAVYHCDIEGSNEWQQGTPSQHYQCALLQADGRSDLEKHPDWGGNTGDAGDLFWEIPGTALTSTSNPHTREWNQSESGLTISNISAPGDNMTFTVGEVVVSTAVAKQSAPNIAIPDMGLDGISDTITLTEAGTVRRLKISVDIEHTYIGDLLIQIIAPSGLSEYIHIHEGGGSANLVRDYDSDTPGVMPNMAGQTVTGDWTLHVADRSSSDTGTFKSWGLEIETMSA